MNCHDVAAVLDSRRLATLEAGQRAKIDAHLADCGDCAAAVRGMTALLAEPIPKPPPLDVPALIALERPERRVRRRIAGFGLRPIAFGSLALGGAAFAALGLLSTGAFDGPARTQPVGAENGAGAAPLRSADARGPAADPLPERSLIDYVEQEETAAANALRQELLQGPLLPDGDYFALLKVAPIYPLAAARNGLEGHAIVEFTVTANGDVAEPSVVEASDPVFEAPTLDVVRKFKYKPRVVEGRAVDVDGVRNRITYVLEHDATQTPGPSTPDPVPEGDLDHLEFRSLLAPALECVEVSDLLCVELTLDDIRAIHTLTPSQSAELSRIYGFVYHRLGDYERAIAAYEDAARPFTDASGAVRGLGISALMTVALIHYERHRYQEALDAVIRYLRAAPNPSLGDYLFADKLTSLGAVVR